MSKATVIVTLLVQLLTISALAHQGLAPEEIVFFEEPDQARVAAMLMTGDAHLNAMAFADGSYAGHIPDDKTVHFRGGIYTWAHTASYLDTDGGTVLGGTLRVAAPSILTGAWNPIAGTNWLFDQAIQRATEDWFLFPDPYSGLYYSHLVEEATCTIVQPLQMVSTLSWVNVEAAAEIVVPEDAWVDWNANLETFITRSEAFPNGLSAATKTVCTFSDQLFETKWHDGSGFSIADMLMRFVTALTSLGPSTSPFRGARLTSLDPVIIEVYHDGAYSTAEAQVFHRIGDLFWPYYGTGMAPWHAVAVGMRAEDSRSGATTGEPLDWIVGATSSKLLGNALEGSHASRFIPYEPVLGQYVTSDEVASRYANLGGFLDAHDHMWVGNGPMVIESVDSIARIVVGKRFEGYTHEMDGFLVNP